MASLDSTINTLSQHVEELMDLIAKYKGLPPSTNKQQHQYLAESVQLKIQSVDDELAYVRYEIDDFPYVDDTQKHTDLQTYDRLKNQFNDARKTFRRCQVDSRKRAGQIRHELFGDVNDRIKSNQSLADNEQKSGVVNKAEDVTSIMRQLHRMAEAESIVSAINLQELESSTKSLEQLNLRYSGFNLLLQGSKQLINHLEQADKWDRIYMLASLGFLFLVLCWIIWRRILKAPVLLILSSFKFVLKIGRVFGITFQKPAKAVLKKKTDIITESVVEAVTSITKVSEADVKSITSIISAVVSGGAAAVVDDQAAEPIVEPNQVDDQSSVTVKSEEIVIKKEDNNAAQNNNENKKEEEIVKDQPFENAVEEESIKQAEKEDVVENKSEDKPSIDTDNQKELNKEDEDDEFFSAEEGYSQEEEEGEKDDNTDTNDKHIQKQNEQKTINIEKQDIPIQQQPDPSANVDERQQETQSPENFRDEL